MTAHRPMLLVVVVLAMLTACGVPGEDTPRPIGPAPGARPVVTSPVPPLTQPGVVVERLYFVRDDRLVPVIRRLPTPSTVGAQLELLLAGPNDAEQRAGLTSAVTGTDTVAGVRVINDEALVDLGDGLAGAGRNDEILAYGQIVHTLTTRPDVERVTFLHDGEHLGIPRADGSLSRSPLIAEDYASLLPTD